MQYVNQDWSNIGDFKQAVIDYNDFYKIKKTIMLGSARGADKYYTHVVLAGYADNVIDFLFQYQLPVLGLNDFVLPANQNKPLWAHCRYITHNGQNTRQNFSSIICVASDQKGNPLDPKILDDNYAQIICSILDWKQ